MKIECMLAEVGSERDLDDPRKAAEPKMDGTRIWIIKKDGTIKIFNRAREHQDSIDYTNRLPEIIESAETIPCEQFIIDAEAVVYDEQGRTWFEGKSLS